jgi:hypothetical protein
MWSSEFKVFELTSYRAASTNSEKVESIDDVAELYLNLFKSKITPRWEVKSISASMTSNERKAYSDSGRNVEHVRTDVVSLDVARTWKLITGFDIGGVGVVHICDKIKGPTLESYTGSPYYPGFATTHSVNNKVYEGGHLLRDGSMIFKENVNDATNHKGSIKIYIPRAKCVEGTNIPCSSFRIGFQMEYDVADESKPVPKNDLPTLKLKWYVSNCLETDESGIFTWRKQTECFCPGGRVAIPNGTKLIEEIRKGDVVETEMGPQKVRDVISNHVESHPVCTINGILRITHKHPIKYEGKWVHPKTVAFETREQFTGKLTNLVIDAPPYDVGKHTVIVDGVTCATLGCMIQDVSALDKGMDEKYGKGFWR